MNKHVFTGVFLLSVLSTSLVNAQLPADIDPTSSTSDCAALTYDLRYRTRDIDTNNEVSALQDFLASAGYLNSEPTGYFGLATLAAVKKFQSSNSISPTGFVGPLTRSKIKAQSCDGATPANTLSANPVSNNTTAPSQTTPTTVGNSSASATFDLGTLVSSSNTPILSGSAYGVSQPFGLAIAGAGGDKVWASGNIITTNNRWSVVVGERLNPGVYTLNVYSANNLIGSTKLTVTGSSSGSNSSSSTSTATSMAPSCTVTTDRPVYVLGDSVTISWASKNATYAAFKLDTSSKDRLALPGDKLYSTGSVTIVANVIGITPIVLSTVNQSSSSTCSTSITVNNAGTVSTSAAPTQSSARLIDDNVKANGGSTLYLKGTASNTSSVTVVIVGTNYTGSKDYSAVSQLLKGSSSAYEATSITVPVSSTNWVAPISPLTREGYYSIMVYDKDGAFLTSGTLYYSIKG